MAFLLSAARPNHRRFADRLFKLKDVLHEGIRKTFFGILVGVAGEVMAPSAGQRANVELVLAPAQGLNPDLVKLVAKTRNKQGVAKSAELLLDYGDAFDVLLPVLASGADLQMVGPMDQFMRNVSPEANGTNPSTNAGPQHAAAKPRIEGLAGSAAAAAATAGLRSEVGPTGSSTQSDRYAEAKMQGDQRGKYLEATLAEAKAAGLTPAGEEASSACTSGVCG